MRYLDPKNDLTFKKVFGQHPHLLMSFLNALLPLTESQTIVELVYLPAELVPEVPLMKHSIVDVRCTDRMGRQFIVEMQMLWTDSFKSRVLFNASKAYVQQLGKGREYKGLQPVYALSMVNDIFEPQMTDFYHHYAMVHQQHLTKRLEGLELVFVELPKFQADSWVDKRMAVLWLRYLTEIQDGSEQVPAELLAEPALREAVACLQESAFTRAELDAYNTYWDSVSSERTLLTAARAEGLAEGLAEGIEQGIEQGREIERQAQEQMRKAEKRQTARQLKALGVLPIDQIATITGLSINDIEGL